MYICNSSGSHTGVAKDSGLVRCDVVLLGVCPKRPDSSPNDTASHPRRYKPSFKISFWLSGLFVFLYCLFAFSVVCSLYFCIVLCIVSPFVYSCLFPIFIQVYRPLLPGGNPIAVNKYHNVISYMTILR